MTLFNKSRSAAKLPRVITMRARTTALGLTVTAEHRRGIWTRVCKRERREISAGRDVKLSIANYFRNTIRVYYRWMLSLIGHR